MSATLYGTTTSPYVNKVRITMQILGLWDACRSIGVDLNTPSPAFCAATPLRQIPVLVEADAGAITDSTIICLHLDRRAGGGQLLPKAEAARTRRLALAAVCNGLIDAGAGLRREMLRPAPYRSATVAAHHLARLERGMDHLADQIDALGPDPDLATITLVAALEWIELRHASHGLTQARPALAGWLEAVQHSWVPALPAGAFATAQD
ncbi:glutathione S-transferase [Roseinatronobacter thiooxidans]|uniref:Glutathione S-transferase n=1 Tax=Roseinatronobacter thiooxidans TaxID=121821 RepID=A0A2W7QUF0_9RHOB|nr:glutathione S-transferase family protein [Roseinatronobacter thiooxidans]PZX42045.1 glutathione S-transferase [Roseinatronobacter thiooxidans]